MHFGYEIKLMFADGVTPMVETQCKQNSAYLETLAAGFESSCVRKSPTFDDDGQKLALGLKIFPKSLAVGEGKPTHRSVNSRWWSSTKELLASSSNPLTVYKLLKILFLAMQSHSSCHKIVLTKQLVQEIRQAIMKASPPLGQLVLKPAVS